MDMLSCSSPNSPLLAVIMFWFPPLQKDNNEKVGCLIQYVPTRWQSKADSAASVLYLKDDIVEVCRWAVEDMDGQDLEEVMFDRSEWELLEEVQPTLAKLLHV